MVVVMATTPMIIPAIIIMMMVVVLPVTVVTATGQRIPNRGQGHQGCRQGGQGKHAFHLHIQSTAMDMKAG